MSYQDYYPQEHHSPHVAPPKSHWDPYPQHHQQQLQQPYSPHPGHHAGVSHHSSPLLQHASPHLGHLPPRSYPNLEMPAYPDHGDGMGGPPLVSPLLDHANPSSRGATPPPQGGYYTTLGPHDRILNASRNGSVEPSYAHSAPMLHHSHSPHPRTPDMNHRMVNNVSPYGPTLKVIQWTPQGGDEGSQVTVILDALAITGAPPTQYSIPAFGPGSPALNNPMAHTKTAVTRRFVVVFGSANAPTKFTRAQAIDGNGVGESMDAGPDERDAFVVLTSFVPARQSMGPLDERVMVLVRVVDESSEILEECIVGEWDAMPMLPATPPRYLKRAGEELLSDRHAPALRSPSMASPRKGRDYLSPPNANSHLSPQAAKRGITPHDSVDDVSRPPPGGQGGRHPPPPPAEPLQHGPPQPDLLRTSQIPASPSVATSGGQLATFSNKAILKLHGDLNAMAMGWSNEEWTNRRRLIQFWRQQEGNVINATFSPIPQNSFVPNSIVISCIFRDEWNECFVTSVDTIYLLEALVGVRFTVEEKNRIRRNLEGFKPQTVSKSKPESEPFFKLVMGFPNPKPRNIEKDVKVFPWKILANALKKIISKYSATYTAPVDSTPSVHVGVASDDEQPPQHDGAPEPLPLPPQHSYPPPPHSPHLTSPHMNGDQRFTHSPNHSNVPAAEHHHLSVSIGGSHSAQHSPNPGHSFVGSRSMPTSPLVQQGHGFVTAHPQQHYEAMPEVVVHQEEEEESGGGRVTRSRRATRGKGRAVPQEEVEEPEVEEPEREEAVPNGAGARRVSGDVEESAMGPPSLNHSRAFSDGSGSGHSKRPSFGTSFGAPWLPPHHQQHQPSGAYEYAQDLAGVGGYGLGGGGGGYYEPLQAGVSLRRSSSLEGLREFASLQDGGGGGGWMDR